MEADSKNKLKIKNNKTTTLKINLIKQSMSKNYIVIDFADSKCFSITILQTFVDNYVVSLLALIRIIERNFLYTNDRRSLTGNFFLNFYHSLYYILSIRLDHWWLRLRVFPEVLFLGKPLIIIDVLTCIIPSAR